MIDENNDVVKTSKFKKILSIILKCICYIAFIFLLIMVIFSIFNKHSKDVSALTNRDYDFAGVYTPKSSYTYATISGTYYRNALTNVNCIINNTSYTNTSFSLSVSSGTAYRNLLLYLGGVVVLSITYDVANSTYSTGTHLPFSIQSFTLSGEYGTIRDILLRYYDWSILNVIVDYSITTYLQNLTTDLPSTVSSDTELLTGNLIPTNSTYYTYPASYDVSVVGCDYTYNDLTGGITLFDFVGDITITAKAYPLWFDDPDKNINVDSIPTLSDLDENVSWNTDHFTYQLTYLHSQDSGEFKLMYSLLSYGQYNGEYHYYPFINVYSKSNTLRSDIRETGIQNITFQVDYYPTITYYINNFRSSEYTYALPINIDYTDDSNHLLDTENFYTTFDITLSHQAEMLNNQISHYYTFDFWVDRTPYKANASWSRVPTGINSSIIDPYDGFIYSPIYVSNLNLWVNDDTYAPRNNRLQYVDMFRSLSPDYIRPNGVSDTNILLRGTNVFHTLTTERTLFGDVVSSFLNIQFGEFTIGTTTFRLTLGILFLFIIGLGAIFVIIKVFLGG